ncbi:MAG: transglutaminase-like domain-containing protein [Acidimicrobiia bacterium]
MTGTPDTAQCALRHVSCQLVFEVRPDAVLALQVAPAKTAGELVTEQIEVMLDGRPLSEPVVERAAGGTGRIHLVRSGAGTLAVSYAATIRAPLPRPPATSPAAGDETGYDTESIVALRQSRYCPSDAMIGFAATELAHLEHGPGLAGEVASWVFERLARADSSDPLDTAVDTLLSGAGVCRDFAHLTIALCRALGVPARFVSAYAPGLSPMEFHAVVEARRDGVWDVLDPTRLAPRLSLVRIGTGRDAADTAFVTTLRGEAELLSSEVVAVVDGDLPADDHLTPISLP